MSTKELKAKRRKLVWYEGTKEWDKFPLIILTKVIKEQTWFKGNIFVQGESNAQAEAKWITDPDNWTEPITLFLIQTYKDEKIKVEVRWIFEETRCSIVLAKPINDAYYPNGSYNAPKPTKSRYIEGALERIEEAFEIALPIIDKKVEEKIEEKRKLEEAKDYHKEVCNELGVELKKSFGKYEPLYEYAYKQGKHFGMDFEKRHNGGDDFTISSIDGHFTLAEIKQLIKYIGGCPSAVASRLTGKKG